MRIVNFGSINIDHVYTVDHFVRPGETLGSLRYERFPGGKGLNQSIALAHAGAEVYHAGKIGTDGEWLKKRLQCSGVDTSLVEIADVPTGHAIIQVNSEGENCIVLYGGANRCMTDSDVLRVMKRFSEGDYLLVQNEMSSIPAILREGKRKGMVVVFNPAPMSPEVLDYPLELVDILIANEIEARGLTGEPTVEHAGAAMHEKHPAATIVITLGARGAMSFGPHASLSQPAHKVKPIDTTAAGDTFVGFFTAAYLQGKEPRYCLQLACRAAALCITRKGAADSIPRRDELEAPPSDTPADASKPRR